MKQLTLLRNKTLQQCCNILEENIICQTNTLLIFTSTSIGFQVKHVHGNVVDGSSMVGFPLVKADSEQDMPGIEHWPLGWHSTALTTELQEVRKFVNQI